MDKQSTISLMAAVLWAGAPDKKEYESATIADVACNLYENVERQIEKRGLAVPKPDVTT